MLDEPSSEAERPGTTYTFQVRAYGTPGFTEFSQPVQRMVI